MTETEEPIRQDDAFDFPDEDDSPGPVQGWLGAVGEMLAALLVVVGLVTLFIGSAVVLRWLLP
jgi:hypothetical protein